MLGPSKKLPSRIGQWDGRKRSSRSEEPVLPYLFRPSVLLRLGVVLVTTVGVTLLAMAAGPPLPYRVGEAYPNDLRVRVYFELVNQPQTNLAREEAVDRLPPGEDGDPRAREEARRAVQPVVDRYPVGLPLVQRGQPITERQ